MSCEVDIKEYFLGEASRDNQRQVEDHLSACVSCREELARLQLTQAALGALRDEELPRRIAFVSDKVFEPRWYQRLWRSGPQLGFIAASFLAGAILVHAFVRPASVVSPAVPVDQAVIEREVSKRVELALAPAVAKAVADSEARQQRKTVELLQAAERKNEFDRRATIAAFAAQANLIQQKVSNMYVAQNDLRAQ